MITRNIECWKKYIIFDIFRGSERAKLYVSFWSVYSHKKTNTCLCYNEILKTPYIQIQWKTWY